MENFGEKLRNIRKKTGLSQKDVAERLGISRQAYAQYEKAVSTPKVQTINRLAEAFQCSPDALLPRGQIRINGYLSGIVLGFRLKNNLTIEQLAKKIDISPENMAKLESGDQLIDTEVLSKIIEALNIPNINLSLLDSYSLNTSIPNTVGLSSFSFPDNPLMPANYKFYYNDSQDQFFIEYPDGFVLQLSFNDFSAFAEELRNYGAYCLEHLRKKQENNA